MSRWHPPDHIARVLELDQADVDEVLALDLPAPERPPIDRCHASTDLRGLTGGRVRRMLAMGYNPQQIARALIAERAAVADLARRLIPATGRVIRKPDPNRRILGPLSGRVRALALSGRSPGEIAEALSLDLAAVRAFLARAFPPPPPPRPPIAPERIAPRQGSQPLKRPRSARELAALSEWNRFDRDDPPPPTAVAVEPPELVRLGDDQAEAIEPEICPALPDEDWGSWHDNDSRRNAKLTDADAARIRRRRAEGVSRADLAREYDVSVATITRITRGDTYRNAAAVEPHALVSVEPATSPVPEPQGERWDEPPGDRRRRGGN